MKLFKGIFNSAQSAENLHQKASLITNFNSCPLGLSLTRILSENQKVIVVSQDSNEYIEKKKGQINAIPFTAKLENEADRNRLIAFLKHENIKIERLIHNQPFMLSPTPRDKQVKSEGGGSLREGQRDLQRVDDLKEKFRILIETPLFVNAELIKQELIEKEGRILQIIQKQQGVYGLLRASQINQRKGLQKQLEDKFIGLSSITPGVYDEVQISKQRVDVGMTKQTEENVEYLNPDDIAKAIVDQLLFGIELREYVKKSEWDIYNMQPFNQKPAPKFYASIQF